MGKYINIGNAEFESVRKDEYVDKSMLIAYVNSVLGSQSKFLCVSRARRFGKSLAAKMLCAYYDQSCDSHALFRDLKIANDPSYEKHLNQYPVIYLDVASCMTRRSLRGKNIVDVMNDELMDEIAQTYPEIDFTRDHDVIDRLYTAAKTLGKRFIMIIDEWDAICRDEDNAALMDEYVVWLRNLFKSNLADHAFAGVYMTGILPIKQYNTESALNNFVEFSMINPGRLAGYFGFTKDEVQALCKKYKMDAAQIKQWYDGYRMGDVQEAYNPFAVMRAIDQGKITGYWTSTTTYESLKRYISMNFEGLRDSVVELLAGNEVRVDVGRFANDVHAVNSRDAVLTLLIHLGYLSYNDDKRTVRIPNYEVQQEFERTIQDGGNWGNLAKLLNQSEQLLADTFAGNADAVAAAIDLAHDSGTSILKYNDENSLACVLRLAYFSALKDFTMIRELPTGKGFADIVLLPNRNVDKPAVVLELKFNHSADTAIAQIKEQRYAGMLLDHVGSVLLVGINYDKKTKKHECAIEKGEVATQRGEVSQKRGEVATQRGEVNPKLIKLIIAIHGDTLSLKQIMERLQLRGDDSFRKRYLLPAQEENYVAKLYPDAANSSKQRYYLTDKGIELLKQLNAN